MSSLKKPTILVEITNKIFLALSSTVVPKLSSNKKLAPPYSASPLVANTGINAKSTFEICNHPLSISDKRLF